MMLAHCIALPVTLLLMQPLLYAWLRQCLFCSLPLADYENLAHVAHPDEGDYSNLQH